MTAEDFLVDDPAAAAPNADQFLTESASAEDFLTDKPGAIEGTANEFKRGLLAGQQEIIASQLATAQKAPSMRQLRRGYVQAMSDPRYMDARNAAGNDPIQLQRVDAALGPEARVGRITTAITANRAALSEQIAGLEQEQQAIPNSEAMDAWGKADNSNWWKVLAKNPSQTTQIIAGIMAQSLPAMAPAMAANVIAPGGRIGHAMATGAGSFTTEAANSFLDSARQSGYDFTDPAKVREFFENPEAQATAKAFAVKRGVPIGIFDAITAGLAGKFVAPALRQGAKKILVGTAKEVGLQMAGGASGEAAGQLVSGQKLSAKDIVAEALGEIASGPQEAISNLRESKAHQTASVEPPAQPGRPPNDELPSAPPVGTPVGTPSTASPTTSTAEAFLSSAAPAESNPTENVPGPAATSAAAPEQSSVAAVGRPPETIPTPAAQLEAVQAGKRSIMLVPPGEPMPEVPPGLATHTVPGREDVGTFIYNPNVRRTGHINQAVANETLGKMLGYDVATKPKPNANPAAAVGTPPQTEPGPAPTPPAAQVIEARPNVSPSPGREGRGEGGRSEVPVTERHLKEARTALLSQQPPDVLDDIAAGYRGPVRFPAADFKDTLAQARGQARERMSLTQGEPADQVLQSLAADNPKYADWSVDDLAQAILEAGEQRIAGRRPDSSAVQSLAREIASAEAVKSADPNWRVTVQSPVELSPGQTMPGYVQIDDVAGGQNNWSKGPAELRDAGYSIPDFSNLPQGQYSFAKAYSAIDDALTRAIQATDLKPGQLMEGVTGAPVWLPRSALNGLLRVVRATFRGTRSLAQAIQAGLEWLRAQQLPDYSETEAKSWLERNLSTTANDDDLNIREFTDQLAADQPLPPDPARLVANLLYDRRTNESDAAFAARVMDAVGGPQPAIDVFTDATNGMPGSVRMMLGQLIIKAMGLAGQHDAAARFYDETFAAHITNTAQALQSLNAFLALTPEGKLIWARRKIERAARDLIAPMQPQLDEARKQLDQANATGIEQTTAAPDVQAAAREAVDAGLEQQASTPGTELNAAIRKEVLDQLIKAGLLTEREAEIARLHYEGSNDPSTLAEKLQRAGIPLHDKRAAAINELYKAKTKTEREKIKSRARMARQNKNNPPRQPRQATQAEWIKQARSIPSREIEAAALKLRRALEPSQSRRSPALQEFYQRLTARLTALLPEQAKAQATPLTDAQLIREVFTNPEKYAEVWQQLGTEIRAKYGVEGLADLTNTLGPLSPEGLVQTTMESNLDRIIREQMQALRVKFGQIIRQHYTQQAATIATLKDKIVGSVGLAEADANKLALVVQRRFAQLVTASKQAALAKLLQPVQRSGLAKPGLIEKIVAASNLGALSAEQFWNAGRTNLELPAWNNELAARIRNQIDTLERVPADQLERKQKTQTELLNTIERAKGLDSYDLGIAFYLTNVLTGVTTHAKNLLSTFLNVSGALGVETARAVASGHLDDLPLLLEALGQGFKRGQLAAGDVLRTGVVTGSRMTKLEPGRALELTQFGKPGGVPARSAMTKAVLENRLAGILNLWKYNYRLMAAEDLLFFKPAEEAKTALLAKRLARSEGLKGEAAQDRARQILGYGSKAVATAQAQAQQEGLKGSAAARRTAELLNAGRPLDIREDAVQFALRSTFNNDPYGALGFVASLINQAKVSDNAKIKLGANLIAPFTNIIANVVNESLNYTPVGAVRARWSGDKLLGYEKAKLSLPQQADLRAELYSKAMVGTALLTALALKAAGHLDDPDPEFAIYGSGPAAGPDRQGLEAKGWSAHTIKLGDRYYSYANTPLALPMAWLGGIQDRMRDARIYQNRSAQRTAQSLPMMAAASAVGMGKVITDQSFMAGIMNWAGILSEPNVEISGRNLLKQGVGVASSFVVPNAVRQVDKFFDPKVYEQRTAEGILVNAIPFVRGAEGQPALNALGRPITRPLSQQFTSSQADVPPLVKYLAESGNWPTMPNRNEIYPRTGRTMTDAEYYNFVKGSGEIAYDHLEKLRAAGTLARYKDDATRAKVVSQYFETSRKQWRSRNGW